MTGDMRVTHPTKVVLGLLLATPEQSRYGHELTKHTDINKNTVYRILSRFEQRGWLTSELVDNKERGKPARRYYKLTKQGQVAASQLLRTGAKGTELQ